MRLLIISILLTTFNLNFAQISQQIKIQKVFKFTNHAIYEGKGMVGDRMREGKFEVYWTENQPFVALKTVDKENYTTGIIIVDDTEKLIYYLDEREKRGIIVDYQYVGASQKAPQCQLKQADETKQVLGYLAQKFTCSTKNRNYEIWIAQKAISIIQPLMLLKKANSDFLSSNDQIKGLIVEAKISDNNQKLISHFKLTLLEQGKYFEFDLSKYILTKITSQ